MMTLKSLKVSQSRLHRERARAARNFDRLEVKFKLKSRRNEMIEFAVMALNVAN